jgi:opacity protein-like surface antigen
MRIVVWSLLLLVGLSADARAQAPESRGTVGGTVGVGRTWDDEGGLGTGPAIGGRIDWRIFGNTSLGAAIDSLSHDRSGGFFEAEGRTTFLGVSLIQRFGRNAVHPYVLGGLHLASHSGSTTFDDRRIERDSTDFGYHFGGGIAFRVGERMELGPETRFYMIQPENDSDPAMAYWIGARIGFRF